MSAALAAVASMLLIPPSPSYFEYVDMAVLSQLFCLMAVVAGLGSTGVLDSLSRLLLQRIHTAGQLTAALVFLCFFSAMLLTNDVALLTFVPLTLSLLPPQAEPRRTWTVILETVAANLGSLATPVGNPQNLFLYHHYGLSVGRFFQITLPLTACSMAAVFLLCRLMPGHLVSAAVSMPQARPLKRRGAVKYGWLFLLCLLTVFHGVSSWLCLAAVAAVLLATDRGLLRQVDWLLLATFVCFFIFVGNLSAVPAVSGFLSSTLSGHELLVSALTSQVISNVPAAVLLAPFTSEVRGLLLGVNIGGLGTPVASLASLISYRLYSAAPAPNRGRYLAVFSLLNFSLLFLLLFVFCIFF
ncbi:transporter, YbiR family [Oscillibacter sp. PC13]|uniref:SLC13 family permease n=1 Tax=Oscillibacter sp. PC13 TaxID=1855299 RepID=UPI0008F3E41D|nr:SLC13 family permease [Oscillibacter sp. PC13]SFP73139.1 transporter, YbiR family [Oscillibacter sp. PC13]